MGGRLASSRADGEDDEAGAQPPRAVRQPHFSVPSPPQCPTTLSPRPQVPFAGFRPGRDGGRGMMGSFLSFRLFFFGLRSASAFIRWERRTESRGGGAGREARRLGRGLDFLLFFVRICRESIPNRPKNEWWARACDRLEKYCIRFPHVKALGYLPYWAETTWYMDLQDEKEKKNQMTRFRVSFLVVDNSKHIRALWWNLIYDGIRLRINHRYLYQHSCQILAIWLKWASELNCSLFCTF